MSGTLTIRRTLASDLAALDKLFAESYPALLKADYPPSVLVTALPLISRAQPRLLSSHTYFGAFDESGRALAAGGWTWTAPQGGAGPRDMAHIRHFVTDHRMTRRGIGRRLMAEVVASAAADGVGRLDCQSTLTAVPFYTACGFATIGPIEIQLRPGIHFPAMRMQRVV